MSPEEAHDGGEPTPLPTAEFEGGAESEVGSLFDAIAATPSHVVLTEGTLVGGEFRVVRKLGSGGMGTVYLARDARLERDVALKLHAVQVGGTDAADRLLREARAMAQLSHPNVVTVHEVGTHGDDLFIAMEYVAGVTAREWLRQARTTQEITDLFRDAGRGLAAAHAAGMIHRDFKPDNVLIGDDGRVRVADFGLAREPGASDPVDTEVASPVAGVTVTGAVMGTPAYMAPEQARGEPVDARADQYSFAVSLYEALCGERPAVSGSSSLAHPRLEQAGARLKQVLARALSERPDDRYPNMEALLAELSPPASSGTRGFVIALSLLALAVGAGVMLWWKHGAVRPGCGDGGAAVAEVWNRDTRAALVSSLGAGGPNYAPDVAERVAAVLDQYAASWKLQHRTSCEATRHGEQSPRLLERGMACLHVRLRRLDELNRALTATGSSAAETAVGSASALPAVADCGDAERLENQVDPPSDPAVRAQVDALRDSLARVSALGDTGAYKEARALAESSVGRAEALDYPPVAAEALERLGTVQEKMGEYPAAVKSLDRAYFLARSSGSDELAASIAADLVWINGAYVSDIDEAKRWAQHALADAARAGEGSEVQAKAFNGVGIMYTHLQDYQQAEPMLRKALEIRRRSGQPLLIAQALHAVAMLEEGKGKYAEAIEHYGEILTLVRQAQGDEHPNAVYALVGLGTAEYTRGNYEKALEHYEVARVVAEEALGADHARTGEVYENIALCLTSLGRHAEAIPMLERSLKAVGERNGTTHPSYAQTAMNLGVTLMQAERYDEAAPRLDLAVEVFGAALGPESPWVGMALLNRAELDLQRERYADALPALRKAVDIYAAASPQHEMHAKALAQLSTALRRTGKTREAVAPARKAVDVVVASEAGAATRGAIRFTYARALWEAGGKKSRAEAREVAGLARADFVSAEDPEEAARVTAWLDGL